MVRKTLSKEVGMIDIGMGNTKTKFCIMGKREIRLNSEDSMGKWKCVAKEQGGDQ